MKTVIKYLKPFFGRMGVGFIIKTLGTLSELMLDMGAEYSDGIRLHGQGYELHICPSARRSAVRISVQSDDAEFARELALSAKAVAEALENQL